MRGFIERKRVLTSIRDIGPAKPELPMRFMPQMKHVAA